MRKSASALVVASGVLLVAAPGAAATPKVPAAKTLSPRGRDANIYSLASNRRGDVAVAWEGEDRLGYDRIWVRVRPASGRWTRALTLSAKGRDGIEPTVAITPGGTVLVAYRESRPDPVGVWLMMVATRRPGHSFGKPRRLSPKPAFVYGQRIDVGPDGTAVASWTGNFFGEVDAAVREPGGHWLPSQAVRGGESAYLPMAAIDSAGRATLVWARRVGKKAQVRVSVRPPGGLFGESRPLSGAGADASAPQIVGNGHGDAAVLWTVFRNHDAVGVDITTRAGGGSFGKPQRVGAGAGGDPLATIDADGGLLAALRAAKDPFCYCATRLVGVRGHVGDAFGAPEALVPNRVDDPALAAGPGGAALLVWLKERIVRGSYHGRIRGRTIRPDGSLAPVRALSRFGGVDQPRATVDGHGVAWVAWTRHIGGDSQYGYERLEIRRIAAGSD